MPHLAYPCCSKGPNIALSEFLVWPLINFYPLGKAKSLCCNKTRTQRRGLGPYVIFASSPQSPSPWLQACGTKLASTTSGDLGKMGISSLSLASCLGAQLKAGSPAQVQPPDLFPAPTSFPHHPKGWVQVEPFKYQNLICHTLPSPAFRGSLHQLSSLRD